jgi:predicted nuclease of predicted toxin-antitoxin system
LKVLLDTCVWGKVKPELEAAGYDVVWAGDWDKDPGDDEILAYAYREKRILVTLDKDFGELAIVHRRPHSGIIRLVNLSARQQGTYCLHVLKVYRKDIGKGAIITVDRNRVRIRSTGD